MVPMIKNKPLTEAIRRAGGMRALARKLGIAHPTIMRWKKAPPARVLAIEQLTGVSRYQLRPDIFGYAPPMAATKQDA
jgi:DNA-binding transcriptional regulator YdaS (Cro superfamily)